MNRLWHSEGISEKTEEFCNGNDECAEPVIPNCEDRTILCLDTLPIYEDMIQTNLTSNDTLYQNSLGAKFGYSCKNPGIDSSLNPFRTISIDFKGR